MGEGRDETTQALACDGNPAGGQICIDSGKGLSQGHERMIEYRTDLRRPGFATQHSLALNGIGRTAAVGARAGRLRLLNLHDSEGLAKAGRTVARDLFRCRSSKCRQLVPAGRCFDGTL
ncbi:hypothetical protein GCM10010365_61020 [Streptomyces poonensis]|uniref:Uncharacterized protein n=1 Tax=Streptomyces poonensis TaxID=68255 RepID=A0A918Q305_9ACTN|nr:hypothetical protein GCM10010365_61020 [Streptomyces poonensis]GLJ93408.1 hypothetical protein GCM10017589_60200 [Streptomyces poonensis]